MTENASLAGGGLSGAQEKYRCSLTETETNPGIYLKSATVVLTDTDLGKKMEILAQAPSWQGSASGLTTEYSSPSYVSYTLSYTTDGNGTVTPATFYSKYMNADGSRLYFKSETYTCLRDNGGGGGYGPGPDSPTLE